MCKVQMIERAWEYVGYQHSNILVHSWQQKETVSIGRGLKIVKERKKEERKKTGKKNANGESSVRPME